MTCGNTSHVSPQCPSFGGCDARGEIVYCECRGRDIASPVNLDPLYTFIVDKTYMFHAAYLFILSAPGEGQCTIGVLGKSFQLLNSRTKLREFPLLYF